MPVRWITKDSQIINSNSQGEDRNSQKIFDFLSSPFEKGDTGGLKARMLQKNQNLKNKKTFNQKSS